MLKSRSFDEIIIRYCKFYPAVRHALLIAETLPSTTCTVEHSEARENFAPNNL